MKFSQPLQPAIFLRRYKRFLVDVTLPDGSVITVYCPNTGSMRGCLAPGSSVRISRAANPARKYPYTLEMLQIDGFWVGINTGLTNALVREAIEQGGIAEFAQVVEIKAEVQTSSHSRLDFMLEEQGGGKIYLEVKNCTLVEEGVAMFPDAVTMRGLKHLDELIRLRQEGHGAVIFFCVQRSDARSFRAAAHIDPAYAARLKEAVASGVVALAYDARVRPEGIDIRSPLTVEV